jgi:disulfide bond formation protein DsbB
MSLKRLWPIALTFVLLAGIGSDSYFATCTGSDPCNACKNCRYCRHCAKEGGHCGVCKPGAVALLSLA